MQPGRNDPCHCGSGRKYKNCHARVDSASAPTLRLLGHDTQSEMQVRTLAAVRRPVPWEADVTPVAAHVETQPDGRPAALILAAQDLILQSDLITYPPADAAGVAALIARAIAAQLARGAAPPSYVLVRHDEVAAQLAPLLQVHGVTAVMPFRKLPLVDEFAASLRQHLSGTTLPHVAVSSPLSWAAWKFPVERAQALHEAAARFYTAKPWELLTDADTLELALPSGSRWYACVMGAGGEMFGLALYESLDDVMSILLAGVNPEMLREQTHVGLSVFFEPRTELPKPMRREATDAGWPIAGPSAYPVLWARNTIGGGVSGDQLSDITLALDTIARFAHHLDPATNNDPAPIARSWTDVGSGTVVTFVAPPDLPSLWNVPADLSPCLGEGSRANPRDFCLTPDERSDPSATDAQLLVRFVDASRAMGTPKKRISEDQANVAHFIEVTRFELGVHLPALSEFDLRIFLYDVMPRKTMGAKSHGHAMRQSLKRFFAYLSASEDLTYPWAASILSDKFALDERWDSRPALYSASSPEWMAELLDDLAARVFMAEPLVPGDFNGNIGDMEITLHEEFQRMWLIWRDEEIHAGIVEPDALRAKLAARLEEWVRAPQSRLDGRSPSAAIAQERSAGRRISRRRR